MPVRVESSTPSQDLGQDSSAGHPPPPSCSLLSAGRAFSGTQNVSSLQKDEAWKVNVRIQGIDNDHGYLCGTMEALNVPLADTPVVTFWEGELVDGRNYTFFTGKWEASPEDDIRHWSKFQSFTPLVSQVEADGGKNLDLSNYPYIFMPLSEARAEMYPGRYCRIYFLFVSIELGVTLGDVPIYLIWEVQYKIQIVTVNRQSHASSLRIKDIVASLSKGMATVPIASPFLLVSAPKCFLTHNLCRNGRRNPPLSSPPLSPRRIRPGGGDWLQSSRLGRISAVAEEVPPPAADATIEKAQQMIPAAAEDSAASAIISVLLFVAFVVLSILTIGVIYLAVQDFLQKRERDKFEKEEEEEKKKGGKKVKVKARSGPRGFGQKVEEDED